ncbi:ABC transporter ATP-binding protein [Nocardioides zeae]|uniref:ABC transporter ATP-binding protein n=1 Tax=Nocardioides zeae TaxID=1457234 RepID=A0A6P0HQ88_9ACTN|nr:ABC transporter ATP-binding protein [Nocardioides zeae]NEN79735.1 ABC transporter ATP-binding protein [Nocardioides zeae]
MILDVNGVRAGYGGTDVLHGVSFRVGEGEAVGILGANGAGKTTLMRVVSGQLSPREGTVSLGGRALRRASPSRMVRSGVVLVAEGHEVVGTLTVLENLRLGAFRFWPGKDPAGDELLEEVFDLFPILADRRHQLASLLSGGQQQMLAIGRALMARPQLLLLDEPSLGLAPIVVEEIYERLDRLRREKGLAMVLVEQSSGRATDFCDRVYVVRLGEVVAESAAAGAPLSEESLKAAYFGG